MDRRLYPEHRENWDDRLFREAILAELSPTAEVLDIGAGAGIVEAMDFRGHAARISGIDLDPRVLANPMLDRAEVASAEAIPFGDEAFDVVLCDNVLEHLDRPEVVFAEVARVLRPGGVFLGKTPNKWHYMPTIARLTPTAFHRKVNAMRGRGEADTFPTRYRANSRGALERLARGAGLVTERIELVEGRPEYLRFHPLPYVAGWVYERVVNGVPGLATLRILLIARFRKPAAQAPGERTPTAP